MIEIYGKGFPEEERKNYTSVVFNNVIGAMKTLCAISPKYGGVTPPNEDACRYMVADLKEEVVDEKLGTMLKALWQDPGIRRTYDHRSDFQLTDSAEFFFNRLDAIMQRSYIPSKEDVLRSRVRTTGIVESEFIVEKHIFRMFDVGGQRNERKKWIHCFEKVTAVMFVAAISEYDQKLYEDESTNRVVEALNLFDDIANAEWFRDSCMILFLNKSDIFRDKIQVVPLSNYFNDYHGSPGDADAAQLWLQNQFLNKNRQPKQVFSHITCATNTDNIKHVFNSIQANIIDTALKQAGLK